MVEIKNGHGLCMTCNNAPSCFHRTRRGPALLCETSDDYVPPVVRSGEKQVPLLGESRIALRTADEDASEYAELCVNCGHRRACKHPRREQGVWHCEDYT